MGQFEHDTWLLTDLVSLELLQELQSVGIHVPQLGLELPRDPVFGRYEGVLVGRHCRVPLRL